MNNIDTLIIELRESADISVRSYHVCDEVGIITIRDLHTYLQKNEDFLSIKNCGRKSNKELLAIHEQFLPFYPIETEFSIDTFFEISNPIKFESAVEDEFDKLSVRAKNAFRNYFKKKPIWNNIVKDEFINKVFKIDKLKNVGTKTESEIALFIDKAKELFYIIAKEEFSPLELISQDLKKITGIVITDSSLLESYAQNKFPIILFSAMHLDILFNLDEVEVDIIQNHFKLFDKKNTLKEIGKKFGITNERVRQKREKALQKIEDSCNIFNSLLSHSEYPMLLKGSDIFCLPNDFKESSIFSEIETVGNIFASYILAIIFHDIYFSISLNDRIKRPTEIYSYQEYALHKRINGSYLIRKDIISKSQVINFFEIILDIVCSRREKDYELTISNLIEGEISKHVERIIEIILWDEFNIISKDGKICIARNTPLLVYEYAILALEHIGKPTHLSNIISEIKKTKPEFKTTENGLSAAMRQEKDIFIYFGRTSTYGLKKWEQTFENMKGGTIRDIVEEFLRDLDEPCHISSITEHVNKYRKTDANSIITNLKLTTEKRFSFFKNGYVGLRSKTYNKSYVLILIRRKKRNKSNDIPTLF